MRTLVVFYFLPFVFASKHCFPPAFTDTRCAPSRHAFNVAHAAWELLRCGALLRAPIPYGSLDALALLLAAVLHDAEHPGRINAFEIGAGIPAAVRYNGACSPII